MTTPTSTDVRPLFVRWVSLILTVGGTSQQFNCAVTQAGLTSAGGDPVALNTLCPQGSFSEATERTWNFTLTAVQDVESDNSLQLYLLANDGAEATFEYYPKVDKDLKPVGRGFYGTVTLGPPDNVGNAASGTFATFTATLPLKGKYSLIGIKAAASPGDVFPTEPTVSASDATNAAKLTPLGYVAKPTTAWTTGQQILVNSYAFHWDATDWAPGAAP